MRPLAVLGARVWPKPCRGRRRRRVGALWELNLHALTAGVAMLRLYLWLTDIRRVARAAVGCLGLVRLLDAWNVCASAECLCCA